MDSECKFDKRRKRKKYHRLRVEQEWCEAEKVLPNEKLIEALLCRTQEKKLKSNTSLPRIRKLKEWAITGRERKKINKK